MVEQQLLNICDDILNNRSPPKWDLRQYYDGTDHKYDNLNLVTYNNTEDRYNDFIRLIWEFRENYYVKPSDPKSKPKAYHPSKFKRLMEFSFRLVDIRDLYPLIVMVHEVYNFWAIRHVSELIREQFGHKTRMGKRLMNLWEKDWRPREKLMLQNELDFLLDYIAEDITNPRIIIQEFSWFSGYIPFYYAVMNTLTNMQSVGKTDIHTFFQMTLNSYRGVTAIEVCSIQLKEMNNQRQWYLNKKWQIQYCILWNHMMRNLDFVINRLKYQHKQPFISHLTTNEKLKFLKTYKVPYLGEITPKITQLSYEYEAIGFSHIQQLLSKGLLPILSPLGWKQFPTTNYPISVRFLPVFIDLECNEEIQLD